MEQFCIGENIRRHRRRLGITQKQLAEELCVTPQNISKWEKNLSYPGVHFLAALSEYFGITMDELVGKREALTEQFFIAVNGGGTKTEFCLFSPNGNPYKKLVLGGTNPNSVGIAHTKQVLSDGISELLSDAPNICGIYAGIAGCGTEQRQKEVLAHIQSLCPYSRVTVESDIPSVISGAPIKGDFITAICGTGFVIYAKQGSTLRKYGGFGYLFDNELCGYTLGRDAIEETLAAESGLTQDSLVSKLTETKLGARVTDSIGKLYSGNADYIASFSRVVFDAYDFGDSKATGIIRKLSENTAVLLKKAYEVCGVNKVVLSGGLVAREDIVKQFLDEATDGKFTFYFSTLPQIYGSMIRCIELYVSDEASEAFKKTIPEESGGDKK